MNKVSNFTNRIQLNLCYKLLWYVLIGRPPSYNRRKEAKKLMATLAVHCCAWQGIQSFHTRGPTIPSSEEE